MGQAPWYVQRPGDFKGSLTVPDPIQVRQVMFLAPNIFESFYLMVTGARKLSPRFRVNSRKRLVIVLLVVGVPKLVQEYLMHYLQFPTWPYIKRNVLGWG